MTGHGYFGEYLCEIRRECAMAVCHHCGADQDTTQQTLDSCPAWYSERQILVREMLLKKSAWKSMISFCETIVSQKETSVKGKAKLSFCPCMPPSKFRGKKWHLYCPNLVGTHMTVRDSTFLTKPEVDSTFEELHSVIHDLDSSITTTILDTVPALVNGKGDAKASLAKHRSSVQDTVEEICEYPYLKRVQRLPCLDWCVIRSYRFPILHTVKTISYFVMYYKGNKFEASW